MKIEQKMITGNRFKEAYFFVMKLHTTPQQGIETKDEKAPVDTEKQKSIKDKVAEEAMERYRREVGTNSTIRDILDQAGL